MGHRACHADCARGTLLPIRALCRLLHAGLLCAGRTLRLACMAAKQKPSESEPTQNRSRKTKRAGTENHSYTVAANPCTPCSLSLRSRWHLPVARSIYEQHGAFLGQFHDSPFNRCVVDAVAQTSRAMARMAGGRPNDGRIIPLQRNTLYSRTLSALFCIGRRRISSLATTSD